MHRSIKVLFLLMAAALGVAEAREFEKRESQSEIRQILAQAICLSEGYPSSQVSKDASAVVAAYLDSLKPKLKLENLAELRKLAKGIDPARPTTVDQQNFSIAHCVLFAMGSDVKNVFEK